MPVTTETFRSQNKLNWWFAASSVALVLVTLVAVIEDWANDYREHQVEARVWDGAIAEWDSERADFEADQADLDELRDQLTAAKDELESNARYSELQQEIASLEVEKTMIEKYLGLNISGNIAPVEQRIEWLEALIQTNEGTADHERELEARGEELAYLVEEKRRGDNEIRRIEDQIGEAQAELSTLASDVNNLQAEIDRVELRLQKAEERLAELRPGGLSLLGQQVRNAPLLDWMNPSIQVRQQLVPGVKTQLNLKQTASLDRCMTCHVNIDNDAYTEPKVLDFLERQVAMDQGANLLRRPVDQPVVMLDFWEQSITKLAASTLDGAPRQRMIEAQSDYMDEYNELLEGADPSHPIRRAWEQRIGADLESGAPALMDSPEQLETMLIALREAEGDIEDWRDWQEPAADYQTTLRQIVEDEISGNQHRAFFDTYRYALVEQYNQAARERGDKPLSASRVMLAHPKLDLYAHPDSSHPIATVGCTSCHAGSGEETQFVHSAHTPSDVWVDQETGMLIPDFLVEYVGDRVDVLRRGRDGYGGEGQSVHATPHRPEGEHDAVEVLAASYQAESTPGADPVETGADVAAPPDAHQGHEGEDHSEFTSIHDDLYYADASISPDPFGPDPGEHGEYALYFSPGDASPARAVKQDYFWKDAYHWKEVEYHYWERPMHELRFVESSCARCHTEIMDIDQEATTLARGRYLFGELGCVDCHANDRLGSTLRDRPGKPDIRQVGPSLVHVRHKLSEDMIASWTFAPKAFRPNSRMPHFWLLENNSSPMDIRRSRTEVGAIAYYLTHTREDGTRLPEGSADEPADAYAREPLPTTESGDPIVGDSRAGREVFQSVGCLACHANVNETGLDWVTLDLQERFGFDRQEALSRIAEDAQQLAEHPELEAPETNVGFFELNPSGEPTPRIRPDQYTRLQWYLKTYESERYTSKGPDLSGVGTKLRHDRSEDQALSWLYNWLRNPNHYSSYTIMPNLRLSEQEAMDLASYLLTQEHPNYEPQSFPPDEQMIDALLVNLQANAISEAAARRKIAGMSLEDKVYDLGTRMIQHYGCFGCHEVTGFDSSLPVSANLSSWGTRDPHLLDFGFFDHVYADSRPETADVWKTYRLGLDPDAVEITEDSIGPRGISRITTQWEHVEIDRRGYIGTKLFNTRIFDRYRLSREGAVTDEDEILYTDQRDADLRLVKRDGIYVNVATGEATDLTDAQVRILNVGHPYLKLRMPNFFLRQSDVESLVTFVTSQMPPLVDAELQDTTDDLQRMRAEGKLMALAFNCFGCHNVEQNEPLIQQYYHVRRDDGSINYSATQENLVNAPPRLVGNGAKTQHDWFYHFLNNVEMIRPWLEVRMPSFNLMPKQTEWLVDYLAGASAQNAYELDKTLTPIENEFWDRYTSVYSEEFDRAINNGEGELQADMIAKTAASQAAGELLLAAGNRETRAAVRDKAEEYRLVAPALLPNHEMPDEERAIKYAGLFYDFSFLEGMYEDVSYPFMETINPQMDEVEFRRGERIIEDLGCLQCHVFGDYGKLERIFELEQQELMEMMQPAGDEGDDPYGEADPYGEDDPYGEADPYGEKEDPYGEADPYGEQDPYGEGGDPYGEEDPYGGAGEEETEPAEPQPLSLYDNISAPNLALAHERLQVDFIHKWLRKPSSIQPGTKMPHHWGPDGNVSAFAAFPPDLREQKEALYGKTAEEQIELIVNWLTVAGRRGYTMGEEKLQGADAADGGSIDLDALLEQQAQEAMAADVPETAEEGEDAGETEAAPADEKAEPETPAEDEQAEAPKPRRPGALLEPEEAQADREAAASAVVASTDGAGGEIAGLAILTDPIRPRRVSGNAECQTVHRANGTMLVEQEIVQNPNRTLKNVLVYVKNPPPGAAGSVEREQPLIDQVGCMYTPHVVSLTAGEAVTFRNSDPFAHNLKMTPEKNQGFNVSQPAPGMVYEQTFPNPEMAMRLKCDVHSWMGALVHVFDHPFHAVTDDNGAFEIGGLPDGTYTLVFNHERLGEQEFEVEVAAGEVTRQDVDYTR